MSGKKQSRSEFFGRRLEDALAPIHRNAADVILPAYEDVHNLIYRDKLTGLLNRAGFEKMMKSLSDTEFADYPDDFLAIGMLDVDNFKDVNDGFGHEEGDRVLQKVGDIISSCLREGDVIARWGGDEFAIAMLLHHNFDATTHANVAKGLHLNIERRLAEAIRAGGNDALKKIGVSVGMEICRMSELDKLNLVLDAADTRMYRKKHEGHTELSGRRKNGRAAVNSARRAEEKPLVSAETR